MENRPGGIGFTRGFSQDRNYYGGWTNYFRAIDRKAQSYDDICSDQTSNSLISVHQCHPWIGNADTHITWRIYNRVAITHLLHWMSQKRTYYNKGSPSAPTTSLSERPRTKAPYSSSEKSATWTLQPGNRSAHGICWQYNTLEQWTDKCYHYMHIWLVEALWL